MRLRAVLWFFGHDLSPGAANNAGMRFLRVSLVLLIVGLLISLATAWGCLRWIPSAPRQLPLGLPPKPNDPLVSRMAQYGSFDKFGVLPAGGYGWDLQMVLASDSKKSHLSRGNKQRQNYLVYVRAGWPWRCLDGEAWTLKGETSLHGAVAISSGPLAKSAGGGQVVYPLRPIWSGLLADTALFAGAIGAVWFGVVLIRHRRRREYGRCGHCGYDLRGQLAGNCRCPECGRPSPDVTRPAADSARESLT